MDGDLRSAVTEFVAQHVLLGLGNIRAALPGLDPAAPLDAGQRALGLGRVLAQIDHLDRRARALARMLGRAEDEAPEAEAPLFRSRRRASAGP